VKVIQTQGRILIHQAKHFDLDHTFSSGQCFRWEKVGEDQYRGIVGKRVLSVKKDRGDVEIGPLDQESYRNFFEDYFDLGRDYEAIDRDLRGRDPYLDQALERVGGLRILNQEPFETLISFILSANNNIPRIKQIVNRISEAYGEEILPGFYAFPGPEVLAGARLEDLRALGTGYRDRYIKATASRVVGQGIHLEALRGLETDKAKEVLLGFEGVGSKVAECVLLFSLGKWDVFPEDTWVKKIVSGLYADKAAPYPAIRDFFNDYFGEGAGYAQQVLFHWARNYMMGVK
jgi:N-glycosylase/DNA lyase